MARWQPARAGWLAAALLVLACAFAFVALDPPEALAARPGLAPAEAVPVRQATPDLTVAKTNNVTGLTTVGSTWTWVFAIRNSGAATATFAAGQVVLLDNLPTPNVSYPSVTPLPVGAPTGTLACAVDVAFNLACVASGGSVTIPAGSGFDVTMQSTTLVPGTYVDPRTGGVCRVDPTFAVAESSEANNECGDTVRVVGPDLTVTKTNNVGGTAALGTPWIWTITIRNDGVTPTSFDPGQRFLLDQLPNANIAYGPVVVSAIGGTLLNATCTIDGTFNLACVANGVGTFIPAGSGVSVSFQALSTIPAAYANPRAGAVCLVDPDQLVPENSEANNACANTVTVPGPDLTATKTNNVGGNGTIGVPWTWTVVVANVGTAALTFNPGGVRPIGTNLLIDQLPFNNVTYGPPTVTLLGGTSGNVSCDIELPPSSTAGLLCFVPQFGTLTMPAGGSFQVTFTATASASGVYTNPAGVCIVDQINNFAELNEQNNTCADTVSVSLADLRVTKTNSAGGSPILGTPFTWLLTVSNGGGGPASFVAGQSILVDALPAAGLTYSVPTVSGLSNVTGGPGISCAIAANILTCTATAPVTIGAGGSFQVSIVTRPDQVGSFANPRAGGACTVDPNNSIVEGVETNNGCTDVVTVGLTPPSPPVAPPSANDPNNDDEKKKETEEQRQQRQRTNKAGQDDYRTEGFVVEVRCDASTPPLHEVSFPDDAPYLVIVTIDGKQQLRLLYETRTQCQSTRVGDYAEADGVKEHELLFDAENLTTSRR